uniref:Uncharacterized protein n=1 Tax=Anguilla anguilla TaxID=7936 RepID=A0A0E9WX73_ANGAN
MVEKERLYTKVFSRISCYQCNFRHRHCDRCEKITSVYSSAPPTPTSFV